MAEEAQQPNYNVFLEDNFWETFNSAPQYVQDFITSEQVSDVIYSTEEKYELEPNILGGIIGDFILRIIDSKEVTMRIQTALEVDAEKAKLVSQEVLQRLYAMDDLMRRYMQAPKGVDAAAIISRAAQPEEEEIAPVDYEKTLSKVLPQLKTFISEEDIKRVKNIISSYYGQVRTVDQTKDKLMHSRKIGGLEMDPERAELIVNILRNTDPVRKVELSADNAKEMSEMVKEKSRQIMQISEGDEEKYSNMMQSYLEQQDDISVVALFQAMAGSKMILEVISQRPDFQELAEKMGITPDQYKTPRALQAYINHVYMEVLGFDVQTSAKYMSQLSSIMNKVGMSEYSDMAYYDVDEEIFKFTRYQ